MLTGIHILLTYQCTFECDHCFLYCSPNAEGTFTLEQLNNLLQQSEDLGTVEWIYFEGGEPFLFYSLMLEGVRLAGARGFKVGIVTNAYWATTPQDAELYLRPLTELGINDLSLSDDALHQGDTENNTAQNALVAARRLGLPVSTICIDTPRVIVPDVSDPNRGEPIIGGDAMFRGRAVDKLIAELPQRCWSEFDSCPHEELEQPDRVHVDCFGNVHICQGLSMGNMWETPLPEMVANYDPAKHPICGPLVAGGPAQLAVVHDVSHDATYVDACHSCYNIRKSLIDRFPQHLGPRQVYGLTAN